MKNTTIFFLIVISGALASCARPKMLVYKDVENFRVRLIKQPPVAMKIKFFNPNDYPLTFKSADVAVFINDTHLGQMILDTMFQVPALDSFLLPMALNIDMRNVFPNAARLIFDSSVMVKLDGSVKVGRKKAFVNIPIQYEGQQILDKPRMMLLDDKK